MVVAMAGVMREEEGEGKRESIGRRNNPVKELYGMVIKIR